jgi:hypothetical protein
MVDRESMHVREIGEDLENPELVPIGKEIGD